MSFKEEGFEYVMAKIIWNGNAPLTLQVPPALNFRDNWTTFLKSHLNCSELGDHQFNFEKELNISSQELYLHTMYIAR